MKKIFIYIFVAQLAVAFNLYYLNSAPIENLVGVNRISSEITKYNENYNQYFRDIILDNFSHMISKTELDSLIIIADPMFQIDDKFKLLPDSIDIFKHREISPPDYWDYYISYKNEDDPYNYITYPYPFSHGEGQKDTIRTILRLYTRENKHRYNIILIQPPLVYWTDFKGGSVKNNNYFEDIGFRYAKYDDLPMNYFYLCLDIHRLRLTKCVIINNRIYSLDCMKNKYPKLPFSEVFKLSKEELENCNINNYFSPPK